MQSLNRVAGANVASVGSENCLPVGTRIAEFEITGVVGEGGFGIVYLAFDRSLRRIVALKEYMPGVMAGRGADASVVVRSKRHRDAFDTGLCSFINEARLLAQFDHPALIRIYRFWEQNQTGYMAMRFYQGRTLKQIFHDDPGAVSEPWLMRILRSILEALDALYRVHILHRDISPENIMIQDDGEAVLLDFGAARQVIGGMTQALTVILKPGYAPIEQYADEPSMLQGPWTDIYSLSAVMYRAITGQSPPSSVARMIDDPMEALRSADFPGYSAAFLRAIYHGLAVKPEQRPQSIAAFRALLDDDKPLSLIEQALRVSPVPVPAAVAVLADTLRSATGRQFRGAGYRFIRRPLVLVALTAMLLFACGLCLRTWPPEATRSAIHDTNSTAGRPGHGLAVPVTQVVADTTLVGDMPQMTETATAASPSAVAVTARHTTALPAVSSPSVTKAVAGAMGLRSEAHEKAMATAGNHETITASPVSTVALSIKPWGNVFVDGVPKGVSPPLKRLVLPDGLHSVKVTNPNFPDYMTHVEIGKKRRATVAVDFTPAAP